MIWRFEGGPWDGVQLEVHEDMPAPPHQVVSLKDAPETHYWLANVLEPLTFVYRTVQTREAPSRVE